ncbi:hypothetical protein TNCV_1636761 [Trichonephila clavipes]|nr:hypothetical protein TNCV_1636761 [Trichonephila clavipes]
MSDFHHTIGSANACGLHRGVRVSDAMDALRTFLSAANGVEWYERTPNDVQQTESFVLWFVMWLRDPSLPRAQSACHHGQ